MYKLVISDDEGKTIIVPLVRDLITVGRQDGNTIRLTERNVSRQHARIVREEKGYRIEDLSSSNGITVNGVRIERSAELADGDRVGVGDYVLALRAETPGATTTRALSTRASVPSAGFGAPPPARLVMLSAPAPGAEFSINKPVVSIGRLEDLDLCISHRSISREHARVTQKSGAFEIEDLRSANGVRVNGSAVKRVALSSGDTVELGQVRFRFVGPGETYVFDPSEEQVVAAPVARTRPRGHTVAALVALAAISGGVLAFWQDGSRQAGAAMNKDAREPRPVSTPPPEPQVDKERLTRTLSQCQEDLAAGRYAEAIRAADEGLALPGSGEPLAVCKREAEDGLRASTAYEEGTRALAENKLEDAYFLFAGIPDNHAFRERPEVKNTTERVAQERLARARRQLRVAPGEAHELASSVLDMQGIPEPLREEADRLATQASRSEAAPRARPASDENDPAKVARACLARGDQRCVVRALEGRAQSAQELALLIETYRALGETKKAVKHMESFVTRYASARQTPQYRQFIAKHEQ